MKKSISLLLALGMVVSLCTAVAADEYKTDVVYQGTGTKAYTLTVPEDLAPGETGDVTLSGTWDNQTTYIVSAQSTVTLTNSLDAEETQTLDVAFDGIELTGSNLEEISATKQISVEDFENAPLFGTWSGTFTYTVSEKITDLANTTWKMNDTISGHEEVFDQFDFETQTGWIELPEGSTVTANHLTGGGVTSTQLKGLANFVVGEYKVLSTVHPLGTWSIVYIPENDLGFETGWFTGDPMPLFNGTVTDLQTLFESYVACESPTIVFGEGENAFLQDADIINWLCANGAIQ